MIVEVSFVKRSTYELVLEICTNCTIRILGSREIFGYWYNLND